MEKSKDQPKIYSLRGEPMPYPFKSEKVNTVGSIVFSRYAHPNPAKKNP